MNIAATITPTITPLPLQNIPASQLQYRPAPPPLHRSARLHALAHPERANLADHTSAFLTQYSTVCNTHDLFPTDIALDRTLLSIDDIFSALSDGSMKPTPTDLDDEPTWEQAMASGEHEYWIASGRDELKSLQDLQVFVLVPRSTVPRDQHPLKGKLVCKRKRDETGKVVCYKVRYMAKGFAQRYSINYDKTTAPTVRLESF